MALGDQKQEAPKLPTVEEAIAAWEARDKDGDKIVRGVDGKPVEIVFGYRNSKVVVNGQETIYDGTEKQLSQILGHLEFKNFLSGDVYDGWYEMKLTRAEARGF